VLFGNGLVECLLLSFHLPCTASPAAYLTGVAPRSADLTHETHSVFRIFESRDLNALILGLSALRRLCFECQDSVRKRRDSEQMSTDEESDTDDDVDDESDDNMAADGDALKPTSSKQRNGVCAENNGPVDGLPNDVKGPRFR